MKKRILARSVTYINEWKHFLSQFLLSLRWQFLLLFQPRCVFFFFCPHFCILSHFEIITCIVKLLIATFKIFFCWNTTEKKKTWKVFSGRQSLGAQNDIPVFQTTWIRYCRHLASWGCSYDIASSFFFCPSKVWSMLHHESKDCEFRIK